jgi:metallophosphoesterase (TIGR00282 family)
MKVLFFGDVYGKAGRQALLTALPGLKDEFRPDFVIANAENLADGKGITEKTLHPLLSAGIDAVTGGNHLWDRAESLEYIKGLGCIAKPMNYPACTPGNRYVVLQKNSLKLAVICLCGQIYMPPCDNPFIALENFMAEVDRPDFTNINGVSKIPILLDFHAESTSEKRAMGWFADGKIGAVLGTHTHIQTADEEILPLGTSYISDVGMTGAHDSVIGVRKNIIVEKMLTAIPSRYESSDLGLQVNAVCIEFDPFSGFATDITRIRRHVI